MKSRFAIYTHDAETRVEIAFPDNSDSLMITIEKLDGEKFCISNLEAEAIPEIIGYLQRAEAEYFKRQSRLRGVW